MQVLNTNSDYLHLVQTFLLRSCPRNKINVFFRLNQFYCYNKGASKFETLLVIALGIFFCLRISDLRVRFQTNKIIIIIIIKHYIRAKILPPMRLYFSTRQELPLQWPSSLNYL